MLASQEVILLGRTKGAQREFFDIVKVRNKKKSVKYEKSEKLTFEISIWINKWQIPFFQHLYDCVTGGEFFIGASKRCAKMSSSN